MSTGHTSVSTQIANWLATVPPIPPISLPTCLSEVKTEEVDSLRQTCVTPRMDPPLSVDPLSSVEPSYLPLNERDSGLYYSRLPDPEEIYQVWWLLNLCNATYLYFPYYYLPTGSQPPSGC